MWRSLLTPQGQLNVNEKAAGLQAGQVAMQSAQLSAWKLKET